MMAANKEHVDAPPPAYAPPTNPANGYGYDQPGDASQPGFNPSMHNPYPHHGQTTVVVNQPSSGTFVQQLYVPDHMGLAVFACLCCCWPIGIAAIVKASEVKDHVARGDTAAAMEASNTAATLSKVAIGCGIVISVICGIIMGVTFAGGYSYTDGY